MKFPKPFFRKAKQAWYLQLGKRQISLGPDREQAFKRYQEILLHERGQLSAPSSALTAAQVCDLFLDWCQRHNDPSTYDFYRKFLQDFCDMHGGLRALEVKPFHVTRWLDRHPGWADGSRRCAITAVKRPFNWAESEGLLPVNPVKRVRKPKGRCRDRILAPEERQEILANILGQAFKDFVFAMQETGCRPSEVARVTAADVNLEAGTWTFTRHKTARKTGQPRVVFLTPAMAEVTRKLMDAHPTGPLFLNRLGQPFTRNAIRCRFRQLRRKLPHLKAVVSYCYRHSFVTDALVNGVPAATVAELVGHKDLKMIQEHYAHLAEKRDHLRQAAIQATRPTGP
jgi:integrase